MAYSFYPAPSHRPTYSPPYWDDEPWWEHEHEPVECPGRRSVGQVLGNATATYILALIGYGHLQYFLQGEKSVLKVLYKLVIFIIFPLYPACSLLVEVLRTVKAWRRQEGRRDYIFLLSRMAGLRITHPDGISETLDNRHLGQYSWERRRTRRIIRIAQIFILLITSSQCLGTLIRTIGRLFAYRRGMRVFLATDFESFYLSIGLLAIMIKSWLGFGVNVEWRSDHESAPRSLDISASRTQRQRRTGLFTERDSHLAPAEIVSEIFLDFQTRALILIALYIICWTVLGILSGRVYVFPFLQYFLLTLTW